MKWSVPIDKKSPLRRNLVANYLGQSWTAIVGLAFVPLYIRYLGIESYGLIGLFAVMQAWMTLLDMGTTPTLMREMARYTTGAHSPQSIRELLRSLEIFCFSVAAVIGFGVWSVSGYLASDWLKIEKLPTAVVAQALSIMALVVALRFVEGIYRGSLTGLQKQVWYNGANSILALVRHGGAVMVLAWISRTVQAFFLWQAIISILSIAVFAARVHRTLPKPPCPPTFSRGAIAAVWSFASGMMGITFLTLLLTQMDKVILSRVLTLTYFGYYTLAATVSGVIDMVISPLTQAVYPRMVELSTRDDHADLISIYHQSAQLVALLTAPAAMLFSFFAGGIVFLWSGDSNLAEKTAPILAALALGTFLHGLMWVPYYCQLAHGWTSLAIKSNIVAVLVFIPAIFWVAPHYGAVGAAWTWAILNAGYILVTLHFMHQRLLINEKWRWYFADGLWPTGGAACVMLLARQLQPATYQDRWHWFVFLLAAGCLALTTSAMLANRIRPLLILFVGRQFRWQHS